MDHAEHDLARYQRQIDADAKRDIAYDELARTMYFDALRDLSEDGLLGDPSMHCELDEAVFNACGPTGIDAATMFRLVGEVHDIGSLNLAGRDRRYAALGKYVAGVVEKHLVRIVDEKAKEGAFA